MRQHAAGEFEEVLKSLAWQSPSLSQYFDEDMRFRITRHGGIMTGGPNFEGENELLSEVDIADLLGGVWCSPFSDPQSRLN